MSITRTCMAVAGVAGLACGASANIITFTATQGNLAASATFEAQGTNLVITLANIGDDVLIPADILTAVFWDVSGFSLALTPVSGVLASGSVAVFDPNGQPAGGVVGGEWAYLAGISGPRGAAYGIGSAGFDIFGQANFPGNNLHGPTAVNGMEYGITSVNDDLGTGNPAVTGEFPFIMHEAVFTLSGLPAGFDPAASITNVNFQYGTSLSDPNIPAPGAGAAVVVGGMLAARRRRK